MRPILKVNNKTELIGAPDFINDQIVMSLTLDNPQYLSALKHDRWTGRLEPKLRFYELTNAGIRFYRGYTAKALRLLRKNNITIALDAQTLELPSVKFSFDGQLRDYQETAVDELLGRRFGVLQAPTGSGKTVMAMSAIAQRQQPALILVHTKELLNQWRDRIKSFLGVEAGTVGNGSFDIQPITAAIINTARNRLDDLVDHFGFVIVDECHRTPSAMFTDVVTAFPAKFMLGLSATPYRRDGLTGVINFALGDLVHEVDQSRLQDAGAVLRAEVNQVETDFSFTYNDNYQEMLTAIVEDQDRNLQIARDVIRNKNGSTALVISDRVNHCKTLADLIQQQAGCKAAVLTGRTPEKERAEIVEKVNAGQIPVLLSTSQLLSEGFDCSGLSTLFLTTPIRFSGRLVQILGRILRPAENKRAVVYDYVDSKVGVLTAQAKARRQVYSDYIN